MKEEKPRKDFIWVLHLLNFIASVAMGYGVIMYRELLAVYIILEILLITYLSSIKRRKDIWETILIVLVGLILGFSFCAYQLSQINFN